MTNVPSIFISHGSPMFAIEPGQLGPRLQAIGQSLRDVQAVLVVSPHWQTRGVCVATSPAPQTIHDFGGFPSALYALQYPAPGAPDLAHAAVQLLTDAGFRVTVDATRGLDHGAWVPLRYLFPKADIPVFQVSLPHDLDAAGALRLGQALTPLRQRGVLVVGSGSLTHNLYEFRQHIHDPEYAQAFTDWVNDAVLARDLPALVDYRTRAPHAARAHPTEEHYLPLLVAAGASDADDTVRRIEGGMTYGVLSMDSFGFGLPDAANASVLSNPEADRCPIRHPPPRPLGGPVPVAAHPPVTQQHLESKDENRNAGRSRCTNLPVTPEPESVNMDMQITDCISQERALPSDAVES